MATLAALAILAYVFLHPWLKIRKQARSVQMHREVKSLNDLQIPQFRHIAIALEFSKHDEKLIAHAIGQGTAGTRYLLLHVVESVSARMLGKESDDYETRNDEERLNLYKSELEARGYLVTARLGFQFRAKEIVRMVKEQGADMLVIGAHGHSGIKDFIYGETVNTVRHEFKNPCAGGKRLDI